MESSPTESSRVNVARNAGIISLAVMASRVLGLVRDQVFAIFFGAGFQYDAFLTAFRIPNLLRDLFAEGALSAKSKQLIAVAVAHVTQCPYCIGGHTRAALHQGATAEEIMEAIWVAAEMRAGGAYAHSVIALDTIARTQADKAAGASK